MTPRNDSATSDERSARLLGSHLAAEIEFLAARARSVGTAHANAKLAPLNLKVRSYAVLALACSELKPSQRELADFLDLDASLIVALVDDLETRGLVARTPDPRDRRSKAIIGTAAGHELFGLARAATHTAEREALAALTPEEQSTLRALLSRIAFEAGPSKP